MRILAALLGLIFQAQFEVASIKPAVPDARGTYIRTTPGGTLTINNMPLKELIVFAWRIQPYQITGGPPWMATARWDVSAKPENKPKEGEMQQMMQAMLAERFQLVSHQETREMPVYALVLARKDGKLGPDLSETKECTTPDRNSPPPRLEPGQPPPRFCGQMMMGLRILTAVSVPISNLVPALARMLGRTVIDKTGLTGKYDIKLEWTPDESQMANLNPEAPRPAASDTLGPSIFTALQEQLGLKLESQKGPVEILVVERAEKPSEN